MANPDMDVIKEIPGYRVILKAVLKSQIQQLIEQLAQTTDEESIILTASVADGTLSHLGSDSAKGFLEDHEDVKSQFLGYCLKTHHKRKQEKERKEQEEVLLKIQQQQQQQQAAMAPAHYSSPRGAYRMRSPRFMGPRQPVHPVALSQARHEPYSVPRPRRPSQGQTQPGMRTPTKADSGAIKLEPEDDASNQSAGDAQPSSSQPGSPSQKQSDNDDNQSESSNTTIPTEGLSLGADLSNLVNTEGGEEGEDPNVSVKVEAISEADMELEITGVEPGRPLMPQDWGGNTSGYDQSGATGSPGDMAAQQGYKKKKRHACELCNTSYASRAVLQTHMKAHREGKQFTCRYCRKQFPRADLLNDHVKEEHGKMGTPTDGVNICPYCGKICTSNKLFLLHVRTVHHKNYVCKICGKASGSSHALKSHMKSHTGERDQCERCKKYYFTLKQHQETCKDEPIDYLPCETCGKQFISKRILRNHIREAHQGRTYKCTDCDEEFKYRSGRYRHMKKMHGKVPQSPSSGKYIDSNLGFPGIDLPPVADSSDLLAVYGLSAPTQGDVKSEQSPSIVPESVVDTKIEST